MKIAVVGSEGYVGRALCRRLESKGHEVRRIDALVYGQTPTRGTVQSFSDFTTLRVLRDFRPDRVAWLAAYAHDPEGFITPLELEYNNACRPITVLQNMEIPTVLVSSLSVFSTVGAYPAAKRLLERMAHMSTPAPERLIDIVRFGTLFGIDHLPHQDVESFRSHLLLNNMVFTGVAEGRIIVRGPSTRRPVLPLGSAVDVIEKRLLADGPRGTVSNHYLLSNTLAEFACAVRTVLEEYGLRPSIVTDPDSVDGRDYGWKDVGMSLQPPFKCFLNPLIHWTLAHQKEIAQKRVLFPANLYAFVRSYRREEAVA